MMGHRGCRLGITYPEVTRIQAEALFEASCELARRGMPPAVEVMIPLVSLAEEFRNQAALVREEDRASRTDWSLNRRKT